MTETKTDAPAGDGPAVAKPAPDGNAEEGEAQAPGGLPAPWRIGPVPITPLTGEAARARLLRAVAAREGLRVAYANAHTVVLADRDPRYAELLATRFLVLADGVGVDLAAKARHGSAFPENLNGTDFTPSLLGALPPGTRLFLLGGRPGVAEAAARAWSARFEGLVIAGTRDGYFEQVDAVADELRAARADVLLVAMGNPLQERVIAELTERVGVPLSLGVGALFDFAAGVVPRAPALVRRARAEFLWRLAQEPRRLLGRYTAGVWRFAGAVRRGR